MKRIITLITLVLVSASTLMYAQSSSETRQAERKAQREAQKAREKAENERNYAIAVQALKEGKFVLEADRKSTRLNSSHASKSRMPSSA